MLKRLLISIARHILPGKIFLKLKDYIYNYGLNAGMLLKVVSGSSRTVPHVIVGVTHKCTYRCNFCQTHSYLIPSGCFSYKKNELYYKSKANVHEETLMPLDTFRRLADDLCRLRCRTIDFSGFGEPLLHPDVYEMIRYASGLGVSCNITTNGSLLSREVVDRLLNSGISSIIVSINSLEPETFLKIHGVSNDNMLENLKDSLQYLHEAIRSRGLSSSVATTASFVLYAENFEEIERMYAFCRKTGFGNVSMKPMQPHNYSSGLAIDKDLAARIVARLEACSNEDHSLFLDQWLQSSVTRKLAYPCFTGFTISVVNTNGDVYPCCLCREVMGNINEESFYDIWQGERYEEFRSAALRFYRSGVGNRLCDCNICADPVIANKGLASSLRRLIHFYLERSGSATNS